MTAIPKTPRQGAQIQCEFGSAVADLVSVMMDDCKDAGLDPIDYYAILTETLVTIVALHGKLFVPSQKIFEELCGMVYAQADKYKTAKAAREEIQRGLRQ